jgi:hypothetical protein
MRRAAERDLNQKFEEERLTHRANLAAKDAEIVALNAIHTADLRKVLNANTFEKAGDTGATLTKP